MRQIWDYHCESCGTDFERIVTEENRDEQHCPNCEALAKRVPVAPAGWCPSKERTEAQLKKRSHDHMKWCRDKGIHPNDTGPDSSNACPIWRNKTRGKNTSKSTIDKFRNVHKKYTPGTYSAD